MPETFELVLLVVSLVAAGAAIWAAIAARSTLAEIRRQSEIVLDVGLSVVEPGGQLLLQVQNAGRVSATVAHVAVQIEAPRLGAEHREKLETPMRLTLAFQLAPARSTDIRMVSLVDLSEALLAVSVERADLIALAWDQDGTLHRGSPMALKPIEWRERGRIARMASAGKPPAVVEDADDESPAPVEPEPVAVSDDTGPLEIAEPEDES